ncbi:MAG: hypothetical protein ACKVOE_02245 [Rickettsiales bacterium]
MSESKVPEAVVTLLSNGALMYAAVPERQLNNGQESTVYREKIATGVPSNSKSDRAVVMFVRDGKTVTIDDPQMMERLKGFLIGINADGIISPEERAAASRVITDALDDGRLQNGVPAFAVVAK